jgi:hypothetical protein
MSTIITKIASIAVDHRTVLCAKGTGKQMPAKVAKKKTAAKKAAAKPKAKAKPKKK